MTTKNDHNYGFRKSEFEIIKSIASGNCKITLIHKDIKKDKSNINRILKSLIKRGIVKKVVLNSKNTDYYLTPKCQQILGKKIIEDDMTTISSLRSSSDHKKDHKELSKYSDIRMEYISVKLKILNKRSSWKRERPIALKVKGIDFNEANLKNNSIYSFTHQDVTIKFTSSSVIINFPEESIINPTMMWLNILYRLGFIKGKIERDYDIELSDEIQVCGQEVADIRSAIANYANKTENDKYYVFRDPIDNKPRWKIDKSKGVVEFETMHRLFADEDFEKINKDLLYDFVNSENCYNLSTATSKIEGLEYEKQELRGDFDHNQKDVAKFISTQVHISTQLVDSVNMLRDRIFDPLEEIKNKVKTVDEFLQYSDYISDLSEEQKEELTKWTLVNLKN